MEMVYMNMEMFLRKAWRKHQWITQQRSRTETMLFTVFKSHTPSFYVKLDLQSFQK